MDNYGIDNIETLSFRDGVRSRIAMYLGSADMQGAYNAIQEIISNSVDEYYMGYGKQIKIDLADTNDGQMITISDFGRGIPFGTKKDGTNVLVDIFSRSHTGGKFNNKVYNCVAGLNGIGAKATCLSSLKFSVITKHEDVCARAIFEKGNLIDYKESKDIKLDCSTEVQFILDPEVYNLEPINIDFDVICARCKNMSYLTRGLSFELSHGDKKVKYCAENGLLDLIMDNTKDPVHKFPIHYELVDKDITVEVALQWTKHKEKSFVFTNGLENSEGGTSLTGMKMAITRFMKKQFNGDFDGDMCRTGLIYAVSCKIPNPSFANQTKTKINNPELNGLAQKATTEALTAFSNTDEFKNLVLFLAKERKAELAAQKARDAIINHQKEMASDAKKKVLMVDKLADARHLGETATLLICEGDSAKGALTQGRDVDNYGLLPIRGKCINALANPMEDVLENEEVKSILRALNIVAGQTYNPKKLRYGKIGICVDADRLKILRKF